MTPERRQQIGELLKAAARIETAGREAWLRAACGGDDDLRDEVARLLAQEERADRVGFPTPPESTAPPPEATASWPPHVEGSQQRPGPNAPAQVAPVDDTGGFTSREAIAPPTRRHAISEPPSVVRARLRELPMVYLLIVAASNLCGSASSAGKTRRSTASTR